MSKTRWIAIGVALVLLCATVSITALVGAVAVGREPKPEFHFSEDGSLLVQFDWVEVYAHWDERDKIAENQSDRMFLGTVGMNFDFDGTLRYVGVSFDHIGINEGDFSSISMYKSDGLAEGFEYRDAVNFPKVMQSPGFEIHTSDGSCSESIAHFRIEKLPDQDSNKLIIHFQFDCENDGSFTRGTWDVHLAQFSLPEGFPAQ